MDPQVHQGVKGQPGGVFQAVFVPNTFRQLRILPGIDSQLFQGRQQLAMTVAERRHTRRVLGIQHGAVCQHQAHASQGVVAVLGRATAHATGVIGNNAADLAGVDGSRIGTDLVTPGRKPGVGLGADHTRLQANLAAFSADVVAVPLVAKDNQDGVADGLPGKAGTGGPESHRHLVVAGDRRRSTTSASS